MVFLQMSQQVSLESPLPGFLNDERNHLLIVDVSQLLVSPSACVRMVFYNRLSYNAGKKLSNQ